MGTPSEALCHVGSPRAWEYIQSLPIKPWVPFSALISHANPLAIELLYRMLHFDHRKRITCEEVLNHSYPRFSNDPADGPVRPAKFDFGFEDEDSIEGVRKLIVEEVICSGLRLGRPLVPLDKSVIRIGEVRSISLSVCPDVDCTVLDPTVWRPPREETLSSPMVENHGPTFDLTHQYHQ